MIDFILTMGGEQQTVLIQEPGPSWQFWISAVIVPILVAVIGIWYTRRNQ